MPASSAVSAAAEDYSDSSGPDRADSGRDDPEAEEAEAADRGHGRAHHSDVPPLQWAPEAEPADSPPRTSLQTLLALQPTPSLVSSFLPRMAFYNQMRCSFASDHTVETRR